ncbi:MAG: hypothetical protein AAGA30_13955, partial [Planctomycetota bacterium]
GSLEPWVIALCGFGISLGASIVLFEYVEKPAKSLLKRVRLRSFEKSVSQSETSRIRIIIGMALLLIFVPIGVLHSFIPPSSPPNELQQVIDRAEPETRDIDFGSQMRMLGCEVVRRPKKLELRIVWLKRIHLPHRRIVILLDEKSKQIGRGIHNQELIQNSEQGEIFLDRVYVPYDRLHDVKEVAIYFREKKKMPLQVRGGNRRLKNRALLLIGEKRLQELSQPIE